jgi:hypothetical protein
MRRNRINLYSGTHQDFNLEYKQTKNDQFISGLGRLTKVSKPVYFDPIRNPVEIRLTPRRGFNGGKFSVYLDLKDAKNRGLGYVEVYYEFKGNKVVKAALKIWAKSIGKVCSDWKVLDRSIAKLIKWNLKERYMARVNNKKNANFGCGNLGNRFYQFLKSGKIAKISLKYTNHKSKFPLNGLWVYYRIGRVPNYGTGNFMLLSQGKRATQSSTGWGGKAQYAVDGKTEGRYNQR